MIKKTTIILLTLMLALSIVSCGKSGADAGLTGTEEITMENIDQ